MTIRVLVCLVLVGGFFSFDRVVGFGDELVYRHYLNCVAERNQSSTINRQAAVNRLLSVAWPRPMESEVLELIRRLCEPKALFLRPDALAFYAQHAGTLPDFMQVYIAERLVAADPSDRLHFVDAICHAPAVIDQIVAKPQTVEREGDQVLSTAASVALYHASPTSEIRSTTVRRLLQSRNPEIAFRVAHRVSFLPPPQINGFIDALEASLDSSDSRVQVTAARAILSADPKHPAALQTISSNLVGDDTFVCTGYLTPSNKGTELSAYSASSLKFVIRRTQTSLGFGKKVKK